MPLYSLRFPTAHRYVIRCSTRVPGTAASAGDSTAHSILSQTKPSSHGAPHMGVREGRNTVCGGMGRAWGSHLWDLERLR